MTTNLYNDNRYNDVESVSPGQRQFVSPAQAYRPRQTLEAQKPRPAAQRMPKTQAQALSRGLKKAIAVASVLGFGAFSGVIAYHQINAATTTATSTQSSASQSTSSSSSDSSFFNQQGNSNVGSSSTSSGASSTTNGSKSSNSGSSGASSSTSTAPVTGTSASQVHHP